MGADDLEDVGIKLPHKIRRRPLILPAQSIEAGFHIEAGLSHGSINRESTQRYDSRVGPEVTACFQAGKAMRAEAGPSLFRERNCRFG